MEKVLFPLVNFADGPSQWVCDVEAVQHVWKRDSTTRQIAGGYHKMMKKTKGL